MDTGSRKWGRPYLNRRFFSLLGERMADRVLLVMAKRDGRYIAGALNLIGSDTLYGRYWGAVEEHPCLHFEVCYYQAIDFALAHGLKRVEAGAQGAHKLARGYLPTTTYSAHYIADPNFRRAVANYLATASGARWRIRARLLAEHAPFRHASAELREQDCRSSEMMHTPAYDPNNIFAKILRGELPVDEGLRGRATSSSSWT